jgi:hypothetical protein
MINQSLKWEFSIDLNWYTYLFGELATGVILLVVASGIRRKKTWALLLLQLSCFGFAAVFFRQFVILPAYLSGWEKTVIQTRSFLIVLLAGLLPLSLYLWTRRFGMDPYQTPELPNTAAATALPTSI